MLDFFVSPMTMCVVGFLAGALMASNLNGKGPSKGALGLIIVFVAIAVVIIGGACVSFLHAVLPYALLLVIYQTTTFAAALLVGGLVQSALVKR
jgi:hypothetical protein